MNSIKTQNLSPTLNKLTLHNSKVLFLHLKWHLPIMAVNLYLKPKVFFPHDFTLIASVVGESVIGHGIGGKHIPIMARLAKARRWSKRGQTCLSSPDLTAIHNE